MCPPAHPYLAAWKVGNAADFSLRVMMRNGFVGVRVRGEQGGEVREVGEVGEVGEGGKEGWRGGRVGRGAGGGIGEALSKDPRALLVRYVCMVLSCIWRPQQVHAPQLASRVMKQASSIYIKHVRHGPNPNPQRRTYLDVDGCQARSQAYKQ